jgi:hypothetical protein
LTLTIAISRFLPFGVAPGPADDLLAELKANAVVLCVAMPDQLRVKVQEAVRSISVGFNRPCFISLTKPYAALARELDAAKVPKDRLFIIDCVSRVAEGKQKNCLVTAGAEDLTDLGIAISETLGKGGVDAMVVDNVMVLTLYNDEAQTLKFLHSVITKLRTAGVGTALFLAKDEKHADLAKELYIFVDKVMDLG